MRLPENRQLKAAAKDSLQKAYFDPRKLVVLHTAAMLLVSLLVLAIDFLLEEQIAGTGGLGGVGIRSSLTTAQMILQIAQIIAIPFWQLGWIFSALKYARGEKVVGADLAEGFRRFMPYLRLTVLKGLIFFGLSFGAAYAGAFITLMSPLSGSTMDVLMSETMTEEQLMLQMERLMVPMMAIGCVLALVVILPFFYRFRMAEYVMLDNRCGARAALRGSRFLMKGNMWRMMRLDLSFWWFALLSMAVSTLTMADLVLPLLGVELPWPSGVSYFVAAILGAIAQLILYYFCKAKIDVTYAHAYLSLLPKEEETYESH